MASREPDCSAQHSKFLLQEQSWSELFAPIRESGRWELWPQARFAPAKYWEAY